jgi:hypothetical protein
MSLVHSLFGSVSASGSAATGGWAYFFGNGSITGWGRGDNIDKMDSGTDTLTTLSSVMATGRYQASGNGNAGVAAYCNCGDTGSGNSNSTEKISFTSDSISTLGSTNPGGSYYGGGNGTNQGVKAYYMGGNKYPITATVFDMPFATETWGTLSNSLTYSPLNFPTSSDNGVAAYAAGTYTGSMTNVDKMPFATETPASLSDSLSQGGGYMAGGYGQYGVTGSVFINSYSNQYEFNISFTTDAVTDGTWSITNRKYAVGCSISDTAGYISGGTSFGGGAATWTNTIQKNVFPAMTNSVLSATLSEANLSATSATNELALA